MTQRLSCPNLSRQWQRRTLILLALSFSTLAADDWDLSSEDSTYQILTFFFGTVSEDLICLSNQCSYLVPQLMAVLNQGFVVFSSLVLTFTLLTSTASSAQEGEFLGKRMSSLGTPLRLMLGSGMLLPTDTGYSTIQVLIMKAVVFGAALGNNVYATLRHYVEDNNVTFAMEEVSSDSSVDMLSDVAKVAETMYDCEFCYSNVQQMLWTNQLSSSDADKWGIRLGDTMDAGPAYFSCDEKWFGYAYTVDQATPVVTSCPSYTTPSPNVCGVWTYSYSKNDPNPAQTQATLLEMQQTIRHVAQADATYLAANGYRMSYTDGRPSAELILQSIGLAVERLNYQSVAPTNHENSDNNKNDWMLFPMNFYKWLQYGSELKISSFINRAEKTPGEASQNSEGSYNSEIADARIAVKNQKYFDVGTLRKKLYQDDQVAEYDFVSQDDGPVSYAFTEIGRMIEGGKEPLVTLTVYGLGQLTFAFDMIMTGMIASSILIVAMSICASFSSSFGTGVVNAFIGFMQTFFMAFGFLIPIGIGLGVYLPMVPVLTYTGAVMSWLMSVVEAMVAGPIIALGIMSAGTGNHLLGRAQPGFLLLVRIMLGPGLIVLGLVIGAKMFDIFAAYFTQIFIYGFAQVTQSGAYGAWVGLIFIPYFFFYAFFMVGLGVRCYSMTYLLVDRTTTWIGGQAGGSAGDMQQILDDAKKGAQKGGEEMQAQAQKVTEAASQLGEGIKKANEDDGGGGQQQ